MYIITNKKGAPLKIYGVKEGKFLLEFDKTGKATVESKTFAAKLKKLGYGVEDVNEENGDENTEENQE